MTTPINPEDHERLRLLCDRWQTLVPGSRLHRIQAGPGWVRLLLAGDARLSLLLMARPGFQLDLLWQGKLPAPVGALLKPRKDHPLGKLLADHVVGGCRVFREDRILCLQLSDPDGRPVALLHQVFGTQGNLALLNRDRRLLWAERRPPHSLLALMPRSNDLAVPTGDAGSPEAAALDSDAMDRLARHLADNLVRTMAARLERRRQTASRLVENLARDLATAERGDEFRRKAEALAAHLHEVTPGHSHLEVSDPRDGTPLDIDLDPALQPAANLNAWFKRASKADKGRRVIADRLQDARTRLAESQAQQAALEALPAGNPGALVLLEGLLGWGRDNPDLMPDQDLGGDRRTRRSPYGPEQPARPFRRYLVEDRWEIWVGRDSKENDELTHRRSHLKDIWLHAQGVTGSHVILRTAGKPEQIPQRVIAKAAAVAALHSKARHAGLVPVIWTERRFVRKPRKGAPGLAVCLRENSIMVKPGIGPDVVAI